MSLVSAKTMFQTIFIGIIILIAKGWLYVRSVLSQDDLSILTLMMGSVYLSYSSYFVMANIPDTKDIIDFQMNILYTVILCYMIKQFNYTKTIIQNQF